ncbi:MAG: four helix bundle protein [Candidatus Moraniibacteriota bacterium]|nr:MAG: four helix bundle protein [Candidatus Moranbacteria bacterium]
MDSTEKKYDLEERTLAFAHRVNAYVNGLPRTISNIENGKQLVRSAGSVGANYIEANDGLSRRDFLMRVKISKKEAKESIFWLNLSQPEKELETEKEALILECTELMKILGAIIKKVQPGG